MSERPIQAANILSDGTAVAIACSSRAMQAASNGCCARLSWPVVSFIYLHLGSQWRIICRRVEGGNVFVSVNANLRAVT